MLHDPKYRKKYELNLKREFPRIPFYDDVRKWAKWGKTLMDLHIGYETVKPYPGVKVTTAKTLPRPLPQAGGEKEFLPKAKLKAFKDTGLIALDEATQMTGIPPAAWDYKLSNRSAIEWILDQYKEKTPKDPTIREKFNTYRFADYKDTVVDLLKRVTTVSVQTVEIMREMEATEG